MYVSPPAQKNLMQKAFAGRESVEEEKESSGARVPAPPGAAKPAAAAAAAPRRAKQRGMYSEFLTSASPAAIPAAEQRVQTEHKERNGTASGVAPSSRAPHQQQPKASSFRRHLAPALSLPSAAANVAAPSATLSPRDSLPRLEPKVLVPYEQRAGKPPRRIEIERRKRLYAAQDIPALLRQAGVHYDRYGLMQDHASGEASYLPLELFDNTELECRSPREWIQLGRNELILQNPALAANPPKQVCIPAKALRFDEATGRGDYVAAEVLSYDEASDRFLVRYRDSQQQVQLHRLHFAMESESPFDYVSRVAFAHRTRRALETHIRYALYVDNMPTDALEPLDTEQVNRILLLALNTKKLKQNALDTTSLLNEVNIEYGRTMNKIIFDVNLTDPAQAPLRAQLQLVPGDSKGTSSESVAAAEALVASSNGGRPKRYSYLGVVKLPWHDFPKHFSNFCFHSFYTKLEAITALVKVNSECLRLGKLSIFNTSLSKSVRLDEFEQLQNSSMLQLSSFLKDKWIHSLKHCIKNSLRETSKGWLNLAEKNREVYKMSKLNKFMKMVEFMMEDSLRFLIEDSLRSYQRFLQKAARYKATIIDTNEVKVTVIESAHEEKQQQQQEAPQQADGEEKAEGSAAPADAPEVRSRDFALFNVDLVVKDGVIQYTTSPSQFHSVPLGLFDKALLSLNDIPQLETFVMEHLFWYGNESKLVAVQREEKHVSAIYEAISAALRAAVEPMQEYLDKFRKYDEFLALNIDAYVSEFASLDNDLGDIKKELSAQIAAKERVEAEVPRSVWLGLVSVNCEDVRRKLSLKRAEIIQKELDYFARLTKSRCEEIGKTFRKIESELRKQPADIGELTKLREYMATIPAAVAQQREPILEAMDAFDMLESFSYRLPKEQHKLKWQTFGWPKAVHDLLELKELSLTQEKATFLAEMRTSQEEFMVELLEVEKRVNSFGQYSDMEQVAKTAEKAAKIQEKLEDLQARARHFNNNEMLFGLPATDYRHVTRVVKNFEPYLNLWQTANDWLKNHQAWMHDPFLELNGDNIANLVANYNKSIAKCIKAKVIKDNPGCLAIASSIKKELDAFRPLLPLIIALRNPGMRDRHWDLLSEKLPFPFHPGRDESMTLTRVLDDYGLQQYLEIIGKVGDSASKEYQIESSLQRMEDTWAGKDPNKELEKGVEPTPIQFDIQPFKKTMTYVVRGVDDIINLLDEHAVQTSAMQFSPFKKVFEDRINRWANKLNLVSEVIEEWLAVQRQWISLQAIFQSPDINKQLPAEGKRFASVNKTWRLIMSQVHANPDVLSFGDNPSLLQKLQDCNKMLQMVQKRLSDYLDKKRAAFARFYFLSNDELLEILSKTQEVTAVQPFLKKIFENIHRIEFDSDTLIQAMFSAEEERVDFVRPIDPRKKNVEHWLTDAEQGMKDTMRAQLYAAVQDYAKRPRDEWVRQWPGQCVLNGSQVHWTAEVEAAFRDAGLKGIQAYSRKWKDQLSSMVALVRGELSPIEQMTMGALIVIDVHARDVIDKLVAEECTAATDFTWMAQMRYYLDEADNKQIWVQMVQSRFPYSYEYLGNTLRLVITPLTDRCYMTLMTALSLHLGGAPAGPAGTGKTETTKDLAKAVAKQCVVFNCSDGLNYLAMGKFFKGLASSGAWACFDEFNRIDIEVLSVVAQQIMSIWDAIREGARNFIFEETEITLDPTCSVFITMNPGYAGRTELPDNLQALFRPVSMMVPNYELIAQIMLYSFGFEHAQVLARKMVVTFKLASEQLSSQDHYDYGMRAVKTVITRAGILKKQHMSDPEDQLLLRALNDVNVPKFLKPDLPLFEGIIGDLFPTTKKPEIDYGALLNALILTCKEEGLQPTDGFLEKCIQLYDTIVVRHGVMLVGPAGGGKTTNIRTLQRAMTRLRSLPAFSRVKTHTLNPKAVTQDQLYGASDPYSNEWSDGILAQLVRGAIDDGTAPLGSDKKKRDLNWIVFDGPVDALWIENMNTVLDDNKKLCLVSGEILQITPYMTMVFEVEDLAVASPATVSRCGMVFVEPSGIIAPMVKSWLDGLHATFSEIRKPVQLYCDLLLEPCIEFVRKHCYEPVPSVDNNLAASLLRILDCLLQPHVPIDGVSRSEEAENTLAHLLQHIEPVFILALTWSVGASTDRDGRLKFSAYLRNLLADCGLHAAPPAEGLVYDYTFDYANSQRWIPWMDSVPEYRIDDRLSFNEIVVPTVDSVRYTFLLDLLVKQAKQVLFTGSTGTGKTSNVYQYLSTLPNDLSPISLIFSAATTANQTEDLLFGKMVKRRQRVYGPPLGKRFVIFIDDMNMPKREKYFAQPPIELLRQSLDHGGWFDRRALQFVEIVDCSFIGAMGPPGGGRNPVTNRFLRHFNQVAHTDLEAESLQLIFDTIAESCLASFSADVRELAKPVVQASIAVYTRVISGLLPTPSRSHYTFNLRDLSAMFQGVLSASPRRVTTVPAFMRLWVHENQRVWRDRLINDEDRAWLDALLAETMRKHFKLEFSEIMPKHPLLFGDWMDGLGSDHRAYDEIKDPQRAVELMNEMLADYGEENVPMKLVLFKDAVEHVSRIARILRQPGGHALLLGVGGSGRQSLTKLATFMAEYELFQIEISKNYGLSEFRDDLKRLLLDAGLKEQPTVFLLNETQMPDERFWDDVNNILNSGEVPNLFSAEDQDVIFDTCKLDCQKKNLPVTKINAYAQFIVRIKANLHVVLCMSPMSAQFRTRLRMYPALVANTTCDWFSNWSAEGLNLVATTTLTEEDLQLPNLPALVDVMQAMHNTVAQKSTEYLEELRRYNYVTPTSYLELLHVFKFLLSEKRSEVGGLRSKLQYGLDTLASAGEDIAKLQVDLREKEPRLVETQKEVEVTMEQIAVDKKDAAATKEIVEKQEADAAEKAAECQAIRDDAQSELDLALPMLDKALESLRELNKTHIDEVRNFKKPPAGVILTMEACVIMLRQKLKLKVVMKTDQYGNKTPDYWDTASRYLLKQPRLLLETLKTFHTDLSNLNDKLMEQIKPYILREEFSVKKVESASVACRAICMWVHAMFNFSNVNKTVQPKRIRLKAAEDELEKVMATLNDARENMRQVEERLQLLTDKFEALVAESESLKAGVAMCKVKLERANKLIDGLGGEKVRWESTVAQLDVSYNHLVGDVLISAGTIAYLGAFTAAYREALVSDWRQRMKQAGLPHTEGCTLRQTLGDPVQIRAWTIAGLPPDALSVENGIIMSKGRRWPMLIDPQGQASAFIKKLGQQKFPETGMDITKLSEKNFLQTFENAVRFGKWVLLEDVGETLDPALEPLLLQQIVNVKGVPHIKLGDATIPYNDGFHMYITTKLFNPHYAPELQVKVSLLLFTITPEGLTDQMLSTVVAKESPELEQKKNAMVVQNARMKKQLQDTEDTILRMLSSASGDILDDEDLINTLADSKQVSEEIMERVAESEVIEQEIDQARQAYTSVAVRAQILYFAIADLSLIDPMYQFSLEGFVRLFVQTIANAPPSQDQAERLKTLIDYFTRALFENVCRSLFEAHKLLFSFLLCIRIMQGAEQIDDGEWRFLVAGAAPSKRLPNPAPEWLTEAVWADVLALSDLPAFQHFEVDFVANLADYKRYFDSATPDVEPLSAEWDGKLSQFQKLLVLRCLRPDKMTPALQAFVAANLGPEYVEAPQFSLASSFKDSSPTTPLIFILSKGADPAGRLFQFANEMGFRDRFQSISLGQGQGAIAARYIEEGMKKGAWVLLQNCHLALSWLPTLERILLDLNPEDCHSDARLWLTSEPTPAFPVSILQNGLKMTNEPPKGLRANLMRSYLGFSDAMLTKSKRPREFKKLLYSLCFFHAVVLDRRRFGPLGFTTPYQWTENDLGVSVTQLRDFIDLYPDSIPFRTLHFLTYDINYGGRVTDDVDRRTVATILDGFINPRVLNDEYAFSESGQYLSIPAGTRDQYLSHIQSLPINPEPEVFGLHANAAITSAQEETNVLFSTILALLPRAAGGSGKSREQLISETASSILERTPLGWEVESVSKKFPTLKSESMNTVLVQECIRYSKLLALIRSTLEDLLRALKGEMVMTEALEGMANSLFNNQVPEMWVAAAYPSLMPLAAWVSDLNQRFQFINGWIENGAPVVFWLSGFFFPQSFLTGTLQNFARKYTKPIDSINFSFHVVDRKLDSIVERPSDGVYIHGLYLEGARWDPQAKSLADSRPKELFTQFPVLWLLPEEDRVEPSVGIYKCPVYKILTRCGTLSTTGHSTNFVLFVELPTKEEEAKWIRAGAALFCALKY